MLVHPVSCALTISTQVLYSLATHIQARKAFQISGLISRVLLSLFIAINLVCFFLHQEIFLSSILSQLRYWFPYVKENVMVVKLE